MNKTGIKKICLVAAFAAIMAALAQIAIPTPLGVSLTLQTFAIALAAFLLGAKLGAAATLCYIALGAAGVPVFAGFASGLGVILGPSGGFIFAFPVFAVLLSFAFYVNKSIAKIALCMSALIVLYLAGIIQFIIVSGSSVKVAIVTFLLYFVKDTLVVAAAYFLCGRIRKSAVKFMQSK